MSVAETIQLKDPILVWPSTGTFLYGTTSVLGFFCMPALKVGTVGFIELLPADLPAPEA